MLTRGVSVSKWILVILISGVSHQGSWCAWWPIWVVEKIGCWRGKEVFSHAGFIVKRFCVLLWMSWEDIQIIWAEEWHFSWIILAVYSEETTWGCGTSKETDWRLWRYYKFGWEMTVRWEGKKCMNSIHFKLPGCIDKLEWESWNNKNGEVWGPQV